MLIFLPICGTLVLCTKLLTLIPYDTVTNIFSETEWSEFFINSNVSTCYFATKIWTILHLIDGQNSFTELGGGSPRNLPNLGGFGSVYNAANIAQEC